MTADPPGTGLGLDVIQRRALTDSWVLSYNERYRRGRMPGEERQIREALALARQQRQAGQDEVAVDSDQDGVADFWFYFVDGAPAFLEADRFRTGVRDWRVDLRTPAWKASEFLGWSLTPPVPGPAVEKEPLPAKALFDAASPAGKTTAARDALLARRLLPGLAGELERLPRLDNDTRKELAGYVEQTTRLLPGFMKTFEDEGLAGKLKAPWGHRVDYRPCGRDGGKGEELAVGYSPEGVFSIQFFRKSWLDRKGLLAECFLDRGEVVRIDLAGKSFLRLESSWARVAPSAREAIARRYLGPGFDAYRAGEWYRAVGLWQKGTLLAAVLGDLAAGSRGGILDTELKFGLESSWGFAVDGRPAYDLLEVAVNLGWRKGSNGIVGLAEASARQRRYEEALDLYNLALRLASKLDRVVNQVTLLEAMAAIHKLRGHHDQAIHCLFRSLDLEATLAYTTDLVENLPKLVNDTSDPVALRRAVAMRSHSLALNRGCKLGTIAALYADLGEREQAQTYFAEAERVIKSLGHRYGEADLLNLQAKWDLADGRWDVALPRLEQALRIIREQSAAQAKVLEKKDDPRGKEALQGRALHTFRVDEGPGYVIVGMTAPTDPHNYEALTAGLLGEAYSQRALAGERSAREERKRWLDESARWHRLAVDLHEKGRDGTGQLVARLRLATLAFHREDLAGARDLAVQVEKESRARELFETTWRARALLGAIEAARGDKGAALGHYQQAAQEIESLRAALHSERVRVGFFGSRLGVYEELALLHHERKESEKAWECIERARARSLLDVLAGQEIVFKGREVVRLAREQPLVFQFLRTGVQSAGKEGAFEFQKAHDRYFKSIADRPALQEVASLRSVQPVSLETVRAVLGPKTLLIEFFPARDDLLAAVISSSGLKVVQLKGRGGATLQADVAEFRRLVQDPRRDPEPAARLLFRELLAPCLEGQEKVEHLCIAPAGSLNYLPFHALMHEPGKYLIERYQVSYVSSASALVYSHHRRPAPATGPSRTVVVAEPEPRMQLGWLPYAAVEGQRVHDMAKEPRLLLRGKGATERAVLRELPTAGCFHFAGHTHLLPQAPLRTALLCTPDPDSDGRLEVQDLFGLDLRHCELAVLSACETVLGRWHQGDEIVGLTRSFLRAGVPTVVASLWKVPDESTFRLMIRFHQLRGRPDTTKLEALTQAQREFLTNRLGDVTLTASEKEILERRRKDQLLALDRGVALVQTGDTPARPGQRPHPFFWAAFELLGDWR